jgi:hypothetical protein
MHNSLWMHLFHSTEQTKHKLFHFFLTKISICLLNFMEELTAS